MKTLDHLSIDDIIQTPRPGNRVPTSIRFSSDGGRIHYLFPAADDILSLWTYDIRTGVQHLEVEPPDSAVEDTYEEEMRRQRARLQWQGITHYQFSGEALLIPQHGRLYYRQGSGELQPVAFDQEVVDAQLSADGSAIFGVAGGNVCRIDPQTGRVDWLTAGAEDGLSYGVAEYAAQEELERSHGYWVSPTGRVIALTEVDERHIPRYPIVHQAESRVRVEEHRYPFVGEANARVRLGIRATDAQGQIRWLDWGPEERYLLDVLWEDDDHVLVQTLSRSHQHLAWDRYDGTGRHLGRIYEESSVYWINRASTSLMQDGFLFTTTERGGIRRLVIVDPSGTVQEVAAEGLDGAAEEILAIDAEHQRVYLWMTRNRALDRTLVELNWESGEWRDLTPEPGWHAVVLAPDLSGWVDQHSTWDHPASTVYHRRTGGEPQVVVANDVDRLVLRLKRPESFQVSVGEGVELNGIVYRPEGVPPAGGWPLIVSVYGGPRAQMVVSGWGETIDLDAQYLAQHGFVVMKVDGRGSYHRGPAFEQAIFRHFGDVEVADQRQGVSYVTEHFGADPERVGIYGWSYGGYMTLRALLTAGDVFKVGVAGAPVTDFRWYDTSYTERYLADDQTNHAGYDSTSLIPLADRLEGQLLLIHGLVDENVHFHHSAAMIQAFINAGKDFGLILLPMSRHMVQGKANQRYRTRRTLEFFKQHL